MSKKKIAEEWLEVTESMNNLNVNLGARFKEDPEALFKAFGENNPEVDQYSFGWKIVLSARYIPRERLLTSPRPPPPINFVHGSYRKCINLT